VCCSECACCSVGESVSKCVCSALGDGAAHVCLYRSLLHVIIGLFYIYLQVFFICIYRSLFLCEYENIVPSNGMAATSRINQIIGLFCKRAL